MALEPDILERINTDFRSPDNFAVLDALSAANRNGRINRCVLFAAKGSLLRLHELLDLADWDDRNAFDAGECELGTRVRDLRVSFLIDSPEHFWVSNVAITAHRHGFRLTDLRTQVIPIPPFAGHQTYGAAKFMNGDQEITIDNQNGRWSLKFDDLDLVPFGLAYPLDNEERFRIQFDYLLSRMNAEQTDAPKWRLVRF